MKENNASLPIPHRQRMAGWLVHAFTATGAYVGILALSAICQAKYITAFWLMGIAIVIDAVDGLFARLIKIKTAVPEVNGELLDNIVDFFNYTIVPAFFLSMSQIIPPEWCYFCILVIVLSSAYQFTQVDAKTSDHFFKGFPSYWNIVLFYLFFWQMNPWVNFGILLVLAVLSFVPIKYVYPSRLDYISDSRFLRFLMLVATLLWGVSTACLLWIYPKSNHFLVFVSMGYMILYVAISLYRTGVPLRRYR